VFNARGSFNTNPNPPPTINWGQFSSSFATVVVPAVKSPFDFTPPAPSPDGYVVSQVFRESDGNGSLYAYVYQIQVTNSALEDINSMSVPWNANFLPFTGFGYPAATTPGKDNVYQIDSPPPLTGPPAADPLFLAGTAGQPLVRANLSKGTDSVKVSFQFPQDTLGSDPTFGDAGPNSDLLVVFTNISPILLPANLGTTASGNAFDLAPQVYAPGPEPSAMVLWGLSGVGLAAGAAFRRFRVPPVKMA
jgi:hypothetical protein